jgi:hypothetical protein
MMPIAKGTKLNLAGVAGMLVDSAPSDVLFGARRLKTSPYDPLLIQLSKAGAGKFLRFDDIRAKTSLTARAKKLNIKVLFGEQGNTLWVTLAKAEMETEGVVAPAKATEKLSMSDLALRAITEGNRHTAGEILTWMRSNGGDGLGITQVDRILIDLARAGKIKSKQARPGLDQPERWVKA